MFTGIVTQIGRLENVTRLDEGKRFRIASEYDYSNVDIGASIAHAGCCLTVTAKDEGWHEVEAWEEALRLTTLDSWKVGEKINLERALKIGDELGGHLVSGHVDGLCDVIDVRSEGAATRYKIKAPRSLAKFIAPKGSVALDGTSLTVNQVEGDRFDVLIIAHTRKVTTWAEVKPGSKLNLEVDQMARYAARLFQAHQAN